MTRTITRDEKIYTRVREALKFFPTHIVASLRVSMCTPKVIDALRKQIKRDIGMITISLREEYQYCFWYGEQELDELIRQVI